MLHSRDYGTRGTLTLLSVEEKELLAKAAKLMDELVETLEVTGDKELVQDIEEALRDVREGKTRPLAELIKELGLECQVQT